MCSNTLHTLSKLVHFPVVVQRIIVKLRLDRSLWFCYPTFEAVYFCIICGCMRVAVARYLMLSCSFNTYMHAIKQSFGMSSLYYNAVSALYGVVI